MMICLPLPPLTLKPAAYYLVPGLLNEMHCI